MTITDFQLRVLLVSAGIPAAVVYEPDDSLYLPCRAEWLLGDFSRWWRNQAAPALGMDNYSPESADCDDAVDCHNTLARWAHRRTPEGQGKALPIGRLNYAQIPGAPPGALQRRHAVAWAITPDRGLIFVECQAIFSELKLTVPQLNSATRCSS